jgi:hypothetical protein
MEDIDEMTREELIDLLVDEGYDRDEMNEKTDDELHFIAEQEFAIH